MNDLEAFKKQYTLKQSFYIFLGSKLNLLVFAFCYFFSCLFVYRAFYNKTKSDNPYLEFAYEKYSKLVKFARTRNEV